MIICVCHRTYSSEFLPLYITGGIFYELTAPDDVKEILLVKIKMRNMLNY